MGEEEEEEEGDFAARNPRNADSPTGSICSVDSVSAHVQACVVCNSTSVYVIECLLSVGVG